MTVSRQGIRAASSNQADHTNAKEPAWLGAQDLSKGNGGKWTEALVEERDCKENRRPGKGGVSQSPLPPSGWSLYTHDSVHSATD